MHAESAYLFRHALLRDAAYQLQLPGDRARLHGLAFAILQDICNGPPPEPSRLGDSKGAPFSPHPADPFAEDLAAHARAALPAAGDGRALAAAEALYLHRAAEFASQQYRHQAAERCWVRHAALVEGARRGESLRRAGEATLTQGRPGEAEARFEEARALFRAVGEPGLEGCAVADLASMFQETGRCAEAELAYRQALALHRASGNRHSEGVALGNLANVWQTSGRADEAEGAYEQALAIARELRDPNSEAVALGNLALVHHTRGRLDQAERTYEAALALHRQVGDRPFEGIVLGNLAVFYQITGRLPEAERAYGQALGIQREVGNRRWIGLVLGNLACLWRDTGQLDRAEAAFLEALETHRQVGDRRFEGAHECERALNLVYQARNAEALLAWRHGRALLESLRDRYQIERLDAAMRAACAKAGRAPFEDGPA